MSYRTLSVSRGVKHAVGTRQPKQDKPPRVSVSERLRRIGEIINAVEMRCMAVDGPVTNTRIEMTDLELREIYRLATRTHP